MAVSFTENESNLVSSRLLTLPDQYVISVCLTSADPVDLEDGGEDDELLTAPLHEGGEDDVLVADNVKQEPS